VRTLRYDVVVIGAGLAGLVAAARASSAHPVAADRARVALVARSSGNLNLWSGLVGAGRRSRSRPGVGAIEFFLDFTARAGLPYAGGDGRLELFSPSGRPVRPLLAPATMAGGDKVGLLAENRGPLRRGSSPGLLVTGFTELTDYPSGLIAATITQAAGLETEHRSLSLGPPAVSGLATRVAGLFDDQTWFQDFTESAARVLGPEAARTGAVAFPPVLGLVRSSENVAALEKALRCRVFELPALPPSVPGQRFARFWRHRLESAHGVQFHAGQVVVGARLADNRCLWVEDGRTRYEARAFVLATGGVAGGGLTVPPQAFFAQAGVAVTPNPQRPADPDTRVTEPVFGAEVAGEGLDWAKWGVRTGRDGRLRVGGRPLANVFVAGWQLGASGAPSGSERPDALGSIESAWRAAGEALQATGRGGEMP